MPPLASCEGIHIAFARQQKLQKTYVPDAACLIKTEQHQMLGKPGCLYASANVIPVFANTLDSVFSQIVIPRYAVVLKEREQAIAISEQTLLQGFGRIRFCRLAQRAYRRMPPLHWRGSAGIAA